MDQVRQSTESVHAPVLRGTFLALACAVLTGCSSAHYVVNAPLHTKAEGPRYTLRDLDRGQNSDSLEIVVALSGGGYRAAALAYAVLEQMHLTPIEWEGRRKSLLDEVDVMSGVSGGSLAAAYFATHRAQFFSSFPEKLVETDLQARVWRRLLSPRSLWLQSSSRFGRGDLFEQVLDEHFFGGRTFGDLQRRRPMIYINATEMHHGERFEFTQDTFDHLCSDLAKFPIARAVAASMAVPVLFSPITLWSFAKDCPLPHQPELPAPNLASVRYVHLVDGGLADNTGVRMPLEFIAGHGGLLAATQRAGFRGVQKAVFIVVNAQPSPQVEDDDTADTPGVLRQFRAAVDIPINRSSVDGIGLLRAAVDRWTDQLRQIDASRLEGWLSPELEFHVIEVTLAEVPDVPEFQPARRAPTSLRLSVQELAAMKHYVRYALQRNRQWQQLVTELAPSAP